MKFVDLFSGLGGFHLALTDLGHTCVFACEIDPILRDTYKKNFNLYPAGNIRSIKVKNIPKHDILCAGFPCQPFSKAGAQKGLKDKKRGDLFYYIMRIIRHHNPKFLILENVPNIRRHNEGKTWMMMEKRLKNEGYQIYCKDLSPHDFGIPQVRLRTYMVASNQPMTNFRWPERRDKSNKTSIRKILEYRPKNAKKISKNVKDSLDAWQEFLDLVPKKMKIPLPLWSMEFGATYPYKKIAPAALSLSKLKKYRGAFGRKIDGKTKKAALLNLPSYAQRPGRYFPDWKIKMIHKNRVFFQHNKKRLNRWALKVANFFPSYQKLEWNCNGDPREIRSYIVQIRASGVRVKRLDTSPALVAMTESQVPIIPWENRYMTLRECKRLQSMGTLKYLPTNRVQAYKALGNAVNVDVVKMVMKSLIQDN